MLKIFSVESCLGSSNPGTELAPAKLLEVLALGLSYNKIHYKSLPPLQPQIDLIGQNKANLKNYPAVVELARRQYQLATDSVKPDDIMLTIGGDHSVSYASLHAAKAIWPEACVVYIDAHPDSQEPDTTHSGNLHGMQLATAMGDSIYDEFDWPKYGYDEIFIVGIKDIDPEEADYMQSNQIVHFTMDDIIEQGIGTVLQQVQQKVGQRPLLVSLDIDSIDAEYAPGTGIINAGGLTYREVSYLCRHLSKCNVKAIDLVEVNPTRDTDDKTVELGAELAISLLAGEWSPYTRYMKAREADKA